MLYLTAQEILPYSWLVILSPAGTGPGLLCFGGRCRLVLLADPPQSDRSSVSRIDLLSGRG